MKALKEAQKKYWYAHNFDKSQNHWDAHVELSIFAEGWKQALKWVLADLKTAREGFDLNLYDTLNKELGETDETD